MSLRFYRSGKTKLIQFSQYEYKVSLEELLHQVKSGTQDVYKLLNRYSGWLSSQGLRPKTTIDYVVAAKKLLRHEDILILNELFHEKVSLPKPEEIHV